MRCSSTPSPTSATRRSRLRSMSRSGRCARGFTGRAGSHNASSRRRRTFSLSRHQELICMDELDLFRDFRSGVAAPSEDAQRRASALLATRDRGRTDADSRCPAPASRSDQVRRACPRGGCWCSRYSALRQHALEQRARLPREGAGSTRSGSRDCPTRKWEETLTSTDPACTVERGPNEIWIDQTPPHSFRAVREDSTPDPATDPRHWVCSSGTISELRGTLDSGRAQRFCAAGLRRPACRCLSRPHTTL